MVAVWQRLVSALGIGGSPGGSRDEAAEPAAAGASPAVGAAQGAGPHSGRAPTARGGPTPRRGRTPRGGRRGQGGRTGGAPAADAPRAGAAAQAPATDAGEPRTPLSRRPAVRVGIYAWAFLGAIGALIVLGIVVGRLSLVIIPVVLALFPATLLYAPARWLKAHGVPDAAAAAIVLVGTLAILAGVVSLLAPQVASELDGVAASFREGIAAIDDFLQTGPFGLEPVSLENLLNQAREQLGGVTDRLTAGALGAATAVAQGVTGTVLLLIALFFYLKDGPRIAAWVASVFPKRVQPDVQQLGVLTWSTIGSYFQGQLLVAFVDGVFIGLGLFILGVPLALPLGVLVFFGGLFPIVGAFAAGAVAVLVALATNGLATALAVLVLILAVQQLEGNLLQPIVLGRATALHPLAVILSLTAGGLLLGVLGAFLAVPIAAGGARAVGYLRARVAD